MSMKISKIQIKNLFGIRDMTLRNQSVELSGPKGAGKTSVLDAIRLALTNQSGRDYVIYQGADEGEIIIETDSGLTIDRKKRTTKADAVTVKNNNLMQTRPAEYLSGIFTPLQLNPVEFTQFSRQEKNRVILSLIEFDWDLNWIKEKFGEIPQGVDYEQHILQVLADIQAENGVYFQSRQNINRDIRNKQAFIEDIAKDIPENYDAAKWDNYSLGDKYREIERIRDNNGVIERARSLRDAYDNKVRGIQAKRDIAVAAEEKQIAGERDSLNSTIARLRAEIVAAEEKLSGLGDKLKDRTRAIEAEYQAELAKLDGDVQAARKSADEELVDTTELADEIATAEVMKKHLNEYRRMVSMQGEVDRLQEASTELTRKIELARELPSEILQSATIPINGLTVRDGIPLINDLPISNLSDGELLELCVDITVSKPGQLQIILIDGAERLDSASRERLYKRCKDKGLQIIASRVTDSSELEVIEL